jgi:hypothetical protein
MITFLRINGHECSHLGVTEFDGNGVTAKRVDLPSDRLQRRVACELIICALARIHASTVHLLLKKYVCN